MIEYKISKLYYVGPFDTFGQDPPLFTLMHIKSHTLSINILMSTYKSTQTPIL